MINRFPLDTQQGKTCLLSLFCQNPMCDLSEAPTDSIKAIIGFGVNK